MLNETLIHKVQSRDAVAGVLGLGYVGLPLAFEIARAGFRVTGIDVSREKVDRINRGQNRILDTGVRSLEELLNSGRLKASSDFSDLRNCDFISICVPTPLSKGKKPDMSFILEAVSEVRRQLRRGQVVILESTTYPGTTEEVVLPLLQESGLKVGTDFFLAFSPERIDPGNKEFSIRNTPKLISGITPQCTAIAQCFYEAFIEKVVPLSSPRTAEMAKLLENTFRAVNIGLANEVAIMCHHLGIDTWEVIDAAATKPFGFMPFYPGPGLGGHCIPVDPHYLTWKLKTMDYNPRFIQVADEINSSMPHLVVDKIVRALNEGNKAVKGSLILVLGVAYKKDIDDCRESPALDVIKALQSRGAVVSYHDPHVPRIRVDGIDLTSVSLNGDLSSYDCLAILTNHSAFDMNRIVLESPLVVDTRNATKAVSGYGSKIVKI